MVSTHGIRPCPQVGAYPFEDPQHPNSDIRTFQVSILGLSSCTVRQRMHIARPSGTAPCAQRICAAHYRIPSRIRLSGECVDLLRRIFVVDPGQRIPLRGIKQHPWFLHRDPPDHMQAGPRSRFPLVPASSRCVCESSKHGHLRTHYPGCVCHTLMIEGWRAADGALTGCSWKAQDGWGGAACNGADQQRSRIPSAQTDVQIRQMLQEARQPPFATWQVYQY